jgi:hypothetical protein
VAEAPDAAGSETGEEPPDAAADAIGDQAPEGDAVSDTAPADDTAEAEVADTLTVEVATEVADTTPPPPVAICEPHAEVASCIKQTLSSSEPTWEPVDVQVFAGPMGTAASGFDEANDFQDDFLHPNHDYRQGVAVAVPIVAHDPPYDGELKRRLDELGVERTRVLATSDLQAPRGIWLALIITARDNAPVGSSFDFASGPILPSNRFMMDIDCDLERDGRMVDTEFDSRYPSYRTIAGNGIPLADGWSHFILSFGENSEFIAPEPGDYLMKCVFRDALGEGWLVDVPYRVLPE